MPVTTPIGTFSKGLPGSYTLNFAPSGGSNCSLRCSHHPKNGGSCYAARTENLKPSITVNLERKEANPEGFLATVLGSEKNRDKLTGAPWIRFSAFGSIASPSKWSRSFRAQLTQLAELLADQIRANRVHWPVETREKARALRAMGFPARLSLGGRNTLTHIARVIRAENTPISISVQGARQGRESQKRANIRASQIKARDIRARGLSVVVCPAIAGSSKCGSCRACASDKVNIVIYPQH